jgi:hypothetical protein
VFFDFKFLAKNFTGFSSYGFGETCGKCIQLVARDFYPTWPNLFSIRLLIPKDFIHIELNVNEN